MRTKILLFGACLLALAGATLAQDDSKVVVPKSMLTREQLEQLRDKPPDSPEEVHKWVGVGKEVGEAINASLQAVTTQANNFAQTSVGKLTVVLVVWKVLGDQIVHFIAGIVELLIFLPIWIWSYRKTCMTRSIKMPDKTLHIVEYDPSRGECTPRGIHLLTAGIMLAIWLITVFAY